MDDVRGDVLGPPHGKTPAAVPCGGELSGKCFGVSAGRSPKPPIEMGRVILTVCLDTGDNCYFMLT